MSKSLVDTCIYETYLSIKLLPYANITDITDIDTDIISVSLLNFTDIADISTDTNTDINIGASLQLSIIGTISLAIMVEESQSGDHCNWKQHPLKYAPQSHEPDTSSVWM